VVVVVVVLLLLQSHPKSSMTMRPSPKALTYATFCFFMCCCCNPTLNPL
jgi:hypothetical protein